MDVKREIVDSIQILVDAAIRKTCPVISFGIVSGVGTKGKCTVKINNIDHNVSYYGKEIPTINQKYPVFVPMNNMSLAFILTTGGGDGGTADYNELKNKPSINGVTLSGNLTNADLDLSSIEYDTTAGWNAQTSLMSKDNTIYVYTDYYSLKDGKTAIGVKIGDGKAYVIDLPFVDSGITEVVEEHITNTEIHITNAERTAWNNKVRCYLSGTDNLVFTTSNN